MLRAEVQEAENVSVRLVRDMGALDIAWEEFNAIEERILGPILSSAEFCRVYNINENSTAYKAIAPYLTRKGSSLFLNCAGALSDKTKPFWKTSERLSGKILCCCKMDDLDLDSMLKISWDPSAIRNPGA